MSMGTIDEFEPVKSPKIVVKYLEIINQRYMTIPGFEMIPIESFLANCLLHELSVTLLFFNKLPSI